MRRWIGIVGLGLALMLAGYGVDAVRAQNALPELHPQRIVLNPAVPLEQGETLVIQVDIVNTGDADAGPFNIDYAWRPLGSSNGWTTFATEELSGLRVLDQEVVRTVTLDTYTLNGGSPGPLTQQTAFELRVFVDPEDKVAEQDETNNELRTTFSVFPNLTLGKPDLRPIDLKFDPVSPVSVDSRKVDGSETDVISIASGVANIGQGNAGPFDVQISYCRVPLSNLSQSCPEALTPLPTEVDNNADGRARGGLEEGGMLAVKADLPFRDGDILLLEAGTYLVEVVVDSQGEVNEQDEANNVLIGFLTIRGPELRPIRIDLGSSPVRAGDIVDVIATIENNGSSTARSGYKVSFQINGIPFASVDGPSIDKGSNATVTAQLNTGEFNLASGRAHLLRVEVDSTNQIFEPDETNNALETALTLQPGPPQLPELHPKDIVLTPPSPIEKNVDERLVINSNVVNTGNAPALGFNVEFSFRPQGAMRWQPIPCTVPPENCQDQSLGRGQEFKAQGEVPVDQLNPGVTYEVRVVVDPEGTVEELDPNNNEMVTTLTVRVTKLPDLAITALTTIPEDLSRVRRGQQIQVSAEVTNIGEMPVNEPIEVVCTLRDLLTFLDRLCPGQPRVILNGLDINQRDVASFLVDTTSLTPGFYQIIVTVDPSDAIKELDKSNNTASTGSDLEGNVLVIQGPDLTVLPVFEDPIPQFVIQGDPISFSVIVVNQGGENAPRFPVQLQVDCPDQTRKTVNQEFFGMGTGDSAVVRFTFGDADNPQDPTGPLPIGVCEVNVVVDPDNVVEETNELNNALFPFGFGVRLEVQPQLADLLPLEISFFPSADVRPGERVIFSTLVTNQGGRPSGPFAVLFELCLFEDVYRNRISDCHDNSDFVPVGLQSPTNLDPGEIVEVSTVINDREFSLRAGSYLARVSVDFANEVEESNKDNNVLTTQPPLIVGPLHDPNKPGGGDGSDVIGGQSEADLVIVNFDLSKGSVVQGFKLKFSFDVFNQGIQTAVPFTVKAFYKPFGGGQEFEFERWRIVNGLAAKASITLDARLETDKLEPGKYVITVVVDVFNEVQESFEANNKQERWLRVI